MSRVKLAFVGICFSASSAFAFPLTSQRSIAPESFDFMGESFDFDGIVQLSNCSGSLVRFESSLGTDKALVMTNGHCVSINGGMIAPRTFVSNKVVSRQFSLLSKDGQSRVATVTADKLVYGTMTLTDVAIYQLTQTYDQILSSFHVAPLTISPAHPEAGTEIDIISGYWHRGYGCGLNGFVFELREAGYNFKDSIRYDLEAVCQPIHGTSGSPILATGTRLAVGINNTGNDNGESCTMDNPCEVDENGKITVEKGRGYGQEIYQIYSCLNVSRQIDLAVPGCQLFH